MEMLKAKPAYYDLVQPSQAYVDVLIKSHGLEPLDRARIPNWRNLDPQFVGLPHDPEGKFSVPWLAGTVGIAVDTAQVQEPIKTWTDVFSGKFFGPNLAEMTKSLTKTGIQELAFQEEKDPVVWMRRGDGKLIGSTYRRVSLFSSEPPKFNGWHRHALGSGRLVESITTGSTADGLLETLTMVTNDPLRSVRHVEILQQAFDTTDPLTSAWCVDDAVVPASGQTMTISGIIGIQFNGLWHLNGSTVSVWAAGLDCGDFLVTNGSVFVPYGSAKGEFSHANLANVTVDADYGLLDVKIDAGLLTIPCVIGFTYTSQGQILRVIRAQAAGAANGPALGKTRRTHMFSGLVANSVTGAVSYGTDFGVTLEPQVYTLDDQTTLLDQSQMFTGVTWSTINAESDFDNMISWQITRPYPHIQSAIGGFLQTQDR